MHLACANTEKHSHFSPIIRIKQYEHYFIPEDFSGLFSFDSAI